MTYPHIRGWKVTHAHDEGDSCVPPTMRFGCRYQRTRFGLFLDRLGIPWGPEVPLVTGLL